MGHHKLPDPIPEQAFTPRTWCIEDKVQRSWTFQAELL
jgi:hypothetical protein